MSTIFPKYFGKMQNLFLIIKDKKEFPLEKAIGLTKGSFAHWRKGKAKPSYDALVKIAEYFRVSTDYIFGFTDNPAPAAAAQAQLASVAEPSQIETLFSQLDEGEQMRVLGYIQGILLEKGMPIEPPRFGFVDHDKTKL